MPTAHPHIRLFRHLALAAALTVAAVTSTGAVQARNLAEPSGAEADGIIIGTVVDAGSREPVPGARVTRWLVDAGDLTQYETIADHHGRFLFHGVAPGNWRILVELAGYGAGAFGRRRPDGPDRLVAMPAGGHVTGITIPVFPDTAVISGEVTDELGEPVVGALVRALRPHPWEVGPDGEPVLSRYWQTTRTDDRGRYRLTVEPGRYLIHVPAVPVVTVPGGLVTSPAAGRGRGRGGAAPPPGSALVRGDLLIYALDLETSLPAMSPDGIGRHGVYRSAVAPEIGLSSLDRLLLVDDSEVSGVDLQLSLARAVSVSGRLIRTDGPLAGARVRLIPRVIGATAVAIDEEIATAITSPNGAFTFAGVPAGVYRLRVFEVGQQAPRLSVTAPTVVRGARGAVPALGSMTSGRIPRQDGSSLWAEHDLTVGDENVRDLTISVNRGASVTGRLQFDTDGPRLGEAIVGRVNVSLAGADHVPAGLTRAAAPDGTFATAEYAQGRYLFRASRAGWLLESAMHRGRNLAEEPFALDDHLDDVVVTLTDRGASLAGRVTADVATAAVDASVLVFRADALRWKGFAPRPGTYKAVRVAEDGSFVAGDLLPGEYLAVAVDDATVHGWPHVPFIEKVMPFARRAWLSKGETTRLDLDVQGVR